MYIGLNGLGTDETVTGTTPPTPALNCPGDPGCPGYVAPGSQDYQTTLLQAILAQQIAQGNAAPATTPTTTVIQPGLSTGTALAIGVGAVALLLLATR